MTLGVTVCEYKTYWGSAELCGSANTFSLASDRMDDTNPAIASLIFFFSFVA
jgi:hypothetical protein